MVGQLEYTVYSILRQYPQSLNIAISLNITIGLLLTDIIVILRFDCMYVPPVQVDLPPPKLLASVCLWTKKNQVFFSSPPPSSLLVVLLLLLFLAPFDRNRESYHNEGKRGGERERAKDTGSLHGPPVGFEGGLFTFFTLFFFCKKIVFFSRLEKKMCMGHPVREA